MLEVQDVRFVYPNGQDVIRGLTFSVPRERRVAIVGENGSGKTTLARLMCGLLKPTAGTVKIDGLDTLNDQTIHEVRRNVGIVFQDPEDQIVETTVEREIGFGPKNLGLELDEVEHSVTEALDIFRIQHLRRRPCHLLSAGEKQIVTVASIFAMRPNYVILDESTSLLDSSSRRRLIGAVERLLGETSGGLAFITMRLEDVWMCDEVIFLKGGGIAFRGNKTGFFHFLKCHDFPIYGTPRFISEMERTIPQLACEMSEYRYLSAESLSATLIRLGRSVKGGNTCQ